MDKMTLEVPFALSSLIPNVSTWLPSSRAAGLPVSLPQCGVGWRGRYRFKSQFCRSQTSQGSFVLMGVNSRL